MPEAWLSDRQRCQEAGIAETIPFHPTWEWALQMLQRAWEAGVPFQWVGADTVYGRAVDLRTWLEKPGSADVLAIAWNDAVCVQTPTRNDLLAQAKEIDAVLVKEQDWQRLSMNQGSKGPRLFDGACVPVGQKGVGDGCHWLLIRRCIDDPQEKVSSLVCAPPATTLAEMVWASGKRWHIEEDLHATKKLGLDHDDVRRFLGWYRHITLVLLASAFFVGIGVHDTSHLVAPEPTASVPPLLPLTSSDVRHLLARLFFVQPCQAAHIQAWSRWRRHHHSWASFSHCQRRLKAGSFAHRATLFGDLSPTFPGVFWELFCFFVLLNTKGVF